MKIQCDVCSRDGASVFCCADEAALCDACDRRVHRANKLAGKHRRFSLLHSSPTTHSTPLCDVCQERRGFLFCQEDRAILCRDCDVPIHTANNLTMKHSRFLLTGAKLSISPINSSPPPEEEEEANTNTNKDEVVVLDEEVVCSSSSTTTTTSSAAATTAVNNSSSISEYLIKMLPGWHVEDLLDDAVAADGFCEADDVLPFLEADLGAVAEGFPLWGVPHVPQVPPTNHIAAAGVSGGTAVYLNHGIGVKEANHHGVKAVGRQRWSDDAFMVPQISTVSSNNKRSRPSFSYYY